MKPKAVMILSGGMDSVSLLHFLVVDGFEVHALTFDYGQRHVKEVEYAELNTTKLGVVHKVIDICGVKDLMLGSALTDNIDVPHGHYEAETMKQTVVPNRNATLLSMAYGYAVSIGAEAVYCGVHSGDHAIYPDCRPEFIESLNKAFQLGNESEIEIRAPFVGIDKGEIAKIGLNCGVNFAETWTCYGGGEHHCGQCGACVERQEALRYLYDETVYANPYVFEEPA